MTEGTKDQIEGKLHQVAGDAKEAAGKLLNKPELAAKGRDESLSGFIQRRSATSGRSSASSNPEAARDQGLLFPGAPCASEVVAGNAWFIHHRVQRRPRGIPRRFAAALITISLAQDTQDVIAVDILEQRVAACLTRVVAQFRKRRPQTGALGQNHRSFDEILQFAHVAGPRPAHESLHRLGGYLGYFPVHLFRMLFGEMPGQQRNVFRMVTQRRRHDGEYFQPVINASSACIIPST